MEITCEHCQSKFRIPEGKIPPGKTAVLSCPKCKNKISVTAPADPTGNDISETESSVHEDLASDNYDAYEKPFDFVEEEGKTALLCESDDTMNKTLTEILDRLEYHITNAENIREALTKMRYHNYDLILADENFDSSDPDQNGVLSHIERMQMTTRRKIFVALISSRFRTMDKMMAFNKSVDVILNTENIDEAENILQRSITEKDFFYKVFNQTMEEMGRV